MDASTRMPDANFSLAKTCNWDAKKFGIRRAHGRDARCSNFWHPPERWMPDAKIFYTSAHAPYRPLNFDQENVQE